MKTHGHFNIYINMKTTYWKCVENLDNFNGNALEKTYFLNQKHLNISTKVVIVWTLYINGPMYEIQVTKKLFIKPYKQFIKYSAVLSASSFATF